MSLLQQALNARAKQEAEKPQREAQKVERRKTFFAQRFLAQYGFECGAIELLDQDSFVADGVKFGYDTTWGLAVYGTCPACGDAMRFLAMNIHSLCSALEQIDVATPCYDCRHKKEKKTWYERIFGGS